MIHNSLRIFLLTIVVFFSVTQLHAETFVWTPLQEEPSFSVDVPNNWSKDYTNKKQSAKVYFFLEDSQVNITTQVISKDSSTKYLISLASAELSARFDYLILEEKIKLAHREKVYQLSFLGGKQKQKYIVKMYLLTQENKNLTLVCIAKENNYEKTRVAFDNAAYSFDFSNAQRVVQPKPKAKEQKFSEYLNGVVDKAIHPVSKIKPKKETKKIEQKNVTQDKKTKEK